MKTILAPTDFSPNALVAVQYAIQLAQVTGQRVKLLHSYIKLYTGFDGEKGSEKLIIQALTHAQEKMDTLLNTLRTSFTDVEIIGEVHGGYPQETIIHDIHHNSYSVIVMGTKGVTNAAEKLIGSTTYDVISKSVTPVLAIPENAPAFSLNKIGFFSAYQESDITTLLRLQHILGKTINIHVLHLYTSSSEPIALAKKWETKLTDEFPDSNLSFRTTRVTGINAAAVASIAQQEELNLLVLSRIHKSFLTKIISRSLTHDVANHLNTPTLFINA